MAKQKTEAEKRAEWVEKTTAKHLEQAKAAEEKKKREGKAS